MFHGARSPDPGPGARSSGATLRRARGRQRRSAGAAVRERADSRAGRAAHLRFAGRGPLARLVSVLGCAVLFAGCHGESESERAVAPANVALLDLDGATVWPLRNPAARFVLFLFTRTDCPISNRYAPEVGRLFERFEPLGVEFVLVYPDATQSAAEIREHLAAYAYPCRALRDPRHELARLAGATVTPEAALFGRDGELLYLGRIDDRFQDFGKARLEADARDLENALVAVTSNQRVPVARTRAVGCFLSDLPAENQESTQ